MKQFKHERIRADLRDGRYGGMAEAAIGFARHAGQVGIADGTGCKRTHDLDDDLGVGLPGKGRDRVAIEARPCRRHVEAAIRRQSRKHGFREAERRSVASGRYVMQPTFSQPAGVPPTPLTC